MNIIPMHSTLPPVAPARRQLLASGLAALLAPAGAGAAETYPARPVRLILPNSTGSSVDKVARTLAGPLSAGLGQPMVVENFAGSGGLIGIQQILRAPRDGYTIGIVASNYAITPNLYNLPYDARKDIVPVAVLVNGPFVLVTNPKVPAQTLAEFVALAKSRPADASLTFGTPGVGTAFHLAGEMLSVAAGIKLLHVPYKGNNAFSTDLLGGQLDMGFLTPNVALPFIRAGRLRALGVTTPTRSELLPDVPTIAESGYKDYNVDGWQALVVAAGTPAPVIQRLNTEANRVLRNPQVAHAMREDGHRMVGGTQAQAADWLARDFDRYGKLARTIGMKPE